MNRRIIGDSWPNGKDHFFLICILTGVFLNFRPWTDKAHISFQYVEQLWKLVNLSFPQNSTDPSYPRVILGCRRSIPFSIRSHGSKFVYLEFAVISAYSL